MKIIAIAFTVMLAGSVSAQVCENVIELSKVSNTVVQNNSEVERQASNFCKEYAKTSGSSKSKSFGASYKFLSASFGSSGASMENVASKYCASDNIYSASKDAYRQYIESISPGAYGAYQQCVEMSQQNIRFNVDTGSILPKEFSVSASFISGDTDLKSAILTYSSSDDVRCNWILTAETRIVIPTGSTRMLKCNRQDQRQKSYVTIVHSSSGSTLPLTLPWQAYDDQGNPRNALKDLEKTIQSIKGEIVELDTRVTSNSGSINAIKGSSAVTVYRCPEGTDGWNPGGKFGSYGCQGQISSLPYCINIESPHHQKRDCTALGTIRLF